MPLHLVRIRDQRIPVVRLLVHFPRRDRRGLRAARLPLIPVDRAPRPARFGVRVGSRPRHHRLVRPAPLLLLRAQRSVRDPGAPDRNPHRSTAGRPPGARNGSAARYGLDFRGARPGAGPHAGQRVQRAAPGRRHARRASFGPLRTGGRRLQPPPKRMGSSDVRVVPRGVGLARSVRPARDPCARRRADRSGRVGRGHSRRRTSPHLQNHFAPRATQVIRRPGRSGGGRGAGLPPRGAGAVGMGVP